MLEVSHLTKKFGGLVAVNDLSFNVNEGEILSIIGPNGAGKSTCFKLVSSFLKPTSGKIEFMGRDITGIGVHNVVAQNIVRTFQETTIFKDMTVRDAVVLGHQKDCKSTLLGMIFRSPKAQRDNDDAHENAMEVLDLLGMRHVADKKAAGLPQGMLRNLGTAIALAAKPKLILLDEPFAGLNTDETKAGVELVRKIRDAGITPILVEHDMSAVMSVSDRIVVMNFGSKIAEGTPDEIKLNEKVIEAYLGSEDEELGL
jgi:branched-chain amino acid transport system ATP-binding protein